MKHNTKTKIFLDSASIKDTIEAIKILGSLDGQTTNPTLFSKTLSHKMTEAQLWDEYKQSLRVIRDTLKEGSLSAEVYMDTSTTVSQIVTQAQSLNSLGLDLHVKIPVCKVGICALDVLLSQGLKVNMTLGFDQNQAFSVAAISSNIYSNQVYFSCFVGRVFDNGCDGIANIANIMRMYQDINTPVQILACSFRTLDQFLACLALGVDIVTVNLDIIKQWQKHDFIVPSLSSFHFNEPKPKYLDILHLNPSLVNHPSSMAGIVKFASDWNSAIL
jgi:transaldolase